MKASTGPPGLSIGSCAWLTCALGASRISARYRNLPHKGFFLSLSYLVRLRSLDKVGDSSTIFETSQDRLCCGNSPRAAFGQTDMVPWASFFLLNLLNLPSGSDMLSISQRCMKLKRSKCDQLIYHFSESMATIFYISSRPQNTYRWEIS